MPELAETIYAPELEGGQWIQGDAVRLRPLRGLAIALIDFWDYTCINCIRTLPYIVQWHKRYAQHGLTVIGVHAPEFEFARESGYVRQSLQNFGIEYPVVLDNDYAIWRAYSNRYWPAKYLVDAQGRIRYVHFGEGAYRETETVIQRLLKELHPNLDLPPPMDPIRDTDQPGAVCYRVTPELYLGHARGQFGNPDGVVGDAIHDYRDPGFHAEGLVYLSGKWRVAGEYAQAEDPGVAISLRFTAKDVNLVLRPPTDHPVQAELLLDSALHPGADVKAENGRTIVTVDRARMYNLVANPMVASGSLTIKALQAGLNVYAFTFISCAVT
jgi:thiol-disulfide isomerase/thioredoxin